MSPLSNITVIINPSRDYLKLTLLTYGIAAFAWWQSAWSLITLITISGILFLLLRSAPFFNNSLSVYSKLSYQSGEWILHHANGQQIKYERMSICFDAGFFFILSLTGAHGCRKNITLFADQIPVSQKSLLCILTKIK